MTTGHTPGPTVSQGHCFSQKCSSGLWPDPPQENDIGTMSLGQRPQPSGQSPKLCKTPTHPPAPPQQRRHGLSPMLGPPSNPGVPGHSPRKSAHSSGLKEIRQQVKSEAGHPPMLTRHPPHRGIRSMWPGRRNQEVAEQNRQLPREKPNLLGWTVARPHPKTTRGSGSRSRQFLWRENQKATSPRPCTQRPCTLRPSERRAVLLATSLFQEAPRSLCAARPQASAPQPGRRALPAPSRGLWGSQSP